MSKGMGGHESHRMGKDEWLTPPWLMAALGEFDLDPCAPVNRPWDTARRHFTMDDDGLAQAWEGRVWCNPPYGTAAGQWLARCSYHGNALALVFARTETVVWQATVWGRADAVLFLFGRVRFCHVDGTVAKGGGGAPSALVAYGKGNVEVLRRAVEAGQLRGRLVVLR